MQTDFVQGVSDQFLLDYDFFFGFKVIDKGGNKGRRNAPFFKKLKVLYLSACFFRVNLFADFETRKLILQISYAYSFGSGGNHRAKEFREFTLRLRTHAYTLSLISGKT